MLAALLSGQTPIVTEATSWVDLLERHGGWGSAVVLFGVAAKFYMDGKVKDDKLFAQLDKTAEILNLLMGRK